jgi:hypothetical protein
MYLPSINFLPARLTCLHCGPSYMASVNDYSEKGKVFSSQYVAKKAGFCKGDYNQWAALRRDLLPSSMSRNHTHLLSFGEN